MQPPADGMRRKSLRAVDPLESHSRRLDALDKLSLHAQRTSTMDSLLLDSYGKDPGSLGLTAKTMSYALLSSAPVVNYFRVRWWRQSSAVVAIIYSALYIAGVAIRDPVSQGMVPAYQYYRFTNLEHRNSSLGSPSSPGIAEFGLERVGQMRGSAGGSLQGMGPLCLASDARGSLTVEGATITLSLADKPERMFDSWYLVTLRGKGTEGLDAVRFKLEASDDPSFAESTVVGASSHTYNAAKLKLLFDTPAPIPLERRSQYNVDVRLPDWVMWIDIICWGLYVVSAGIIHASSFSGRHQYTYPGLMAGFFVLFIADFTAAFIYLSHELSTKPSDLPFDYKHTAAHSVFFFVKGTSFLICLFIGKYTQKDFELAFLVHGAFLLAGSAYGGFTTFGTETVLAGKQSDVALALAFLLFGFAIIIQKARMAVKAVRGIAPGKEKYDEVWSKVMQEQAEAVQRLQRVVREMQKEMLASENLKVPRQRNRQDRDAVNLVNLPRKLSGGLRRTRRGSQVTDDTSFSGSPTSPTHFGSSISVLVPSDSGGSLRARSSLNYLEQNVLQTERTVLCFRNARAGRSVQFGRQVDSLDQLHAQAFLVHDLFLDYVVHLGKQHGGKFKLKVPAEHTGPEPEPEFAEWNSTGEPQTKFALGGIKSVKSFVEKLDTAYVCDVSKLLDMVRETLYFDSVTDLESCLRAIQCDSQVEVVQVKSTMDDTTRKLWAGMRFVKLNLRLSGNEEAQDLAVDTHICELVLTLTDIGRSQTREMGKAYRQWRKCKRTTEKMQRLVKQLCSVTCMFGGLVGKTEPNSREEETPFSLVPGSASSGDTLQMYQDVGSGTAAQWSESPCGVGLGSPTAGRNRPAPQVSDDTMEVVVSAGSERGRVLSSGLYISVPSVFHVRRQSISDQEIGSCNATSWGVELSSEVQELIKGLCHLSTLRLLHHADRRWKTSINYSKADGSSFSSAFFSKHPVTAVSHRWQSQVILLVLGVYYAVVVFMSVGRRELQTRPWGSFQHFRLETMLTRDGKEGREITEPGVSDFNVLGRSECSSEGMRGNYDPEAASFTFAGPVGSSFMVSYPESRSMTGWYIKTGAAQGSEPLDPAYFNVWATNDNVVVGDGSCALALGREEGRWWERGGAMEAEWCGAKWSKVGSPQHVSLTTVTPPEHPIKFIETEIDLPMERGLLQTFHFLMDYRVFYGIYVLPPLFYSMGGFMGSFSRIITMRFPDFQGAHFWFGLSFALASVSHLVAASVAFSIGQFILGWIALNFAVTASMLSFVCIRQGLWFLPVLAASGLQGLVGWTAISIWLWHSPVGGGVSFSGLAVLLVAVSVASMRVWSIRKSRLLLKHDQEVYDDLWAKLLEGEDSRFSINHLEKVVRMIGLDARNYCRQHNRLRADKLPPAIRAGYIARSASHPPLNPLFWDLGFWFLPGRLDPHSKVSSINQLYAGAAIANLLVVERLKVWAEDTGGMFMLRKSEDRSGERFVKWADAKNNAALRSQVEWTSLKRQGRAIEKLLRSYQHQPDRLLDISRNCIIFDNMVDMTNCIGKISTDSSVRIERLKNRLSPSYNSDETAGYRDVCINLRVVNKQAETLGAEIHICEVQLVLKKFAELKTNEGHQRYVIARNSRGA
mmetsp:Transcript_35360/g.86064  ORF Transcript_35360/g.86064 Transcript_35360/m.86064 type:complete len:1624 (-) Transcript_35360:129-5000(-)